MANIYITKRKPNTSSYTIGLVGGERGDKGLNYLAEIIAFERWLENNYLTRDAQLLWYRLMYQANKCNWPEWVTVDNLRLMAAMQMSREATFIKVRDDLLKAGLIEYQKGKKGSPNKYRLIPFTFKNVVKSEVETVVNPVVKSDVETVVQQVAETVDIDKYKTETKNKKKDTNVSKEKIDFAAISDLYNSICVSYPTLKTMSERRKKAIRARMNTGYTVDDFRILFKKAESSSFLKGQNNRNWSATFDWLIMDGNMAKVLDGNYDDKGQKGERYDTGRETGRDEKSLTELGIEAGLGREFSGF